MTIVAGVVTCGGSSDYIVAGAVTSGDNNSWSGG